METWESVMKETVDMMWELIHDLKEVDNLKDVQDIQVELEDYMKQIEYSLRNKVK